MRQSRVMLLALAVLVAVSGCSSGPIVEQATPAAVQPDTDRLAAQNVTEHWANQTVAVAEFETELRLSNWRAVALFEPDESATVPPIAVLVVSTPQVEAGDQVALNPLGRLPPDELFDAVLGAGFDDVTRDGTRNRTLLGGTATIHRFTATVTSGNASSDGGDAGDSSGTAGAASRRGTSEANETVAIHVTRVTHGDDYLVLLALHPGDVEAASAVDGSFAAVEHRPAAADWAVDPERAQTNQSYS